MEYTLGSMSLSGRPRSRLLELPAEIRDLIFEFALTSDVPIVAFRLDDYQRDSYVEATQPPLTRVSRQIRAESLSMFYSSNEIVLHTEEKKAKDTQRWLACIEPHLPLLEQLSLWLRYVTLTNDRHASNGCICVSLQRAKGDATWRVQDEWKWITVTKKPSVAGRDATFLRSELRRLIADDPDCIANAQTFSTTVAELKMFYAKEKMS